MRARLNAQGKSGWEGEGGGGGKIECAAPRASPREGRARPGAVGARA